MLNEHGARFDATGVEFSAYPYPPASVYPSGTLPYAQIREVILIAAPPEIRTLDGEVLFLHAGQKDQLRAAAERHGLRLASRVDVWALILEPFLDTEFDAAHQAHTLAALAANGVDGPMCEALRQRLAGAMVAYNFASGLWDWTHLGLVDVLDALRGELSGAIHRLSEADFAAFYWQAMQIANGAQLREAG